MSSPIISIENLGKAYHIGHAQEVPDTLVETVTSLLKTPVRNFRNLRRLNTFGEFGTNRRSATDTQSQTTNAVDGTSSHAVAGDVIWALRDVSFEVSKGQVLGIIGRNGAGKSTLLRILSRITEPTSGRAVLRGRVGSLLEVGTGFHPELTGRENIYMNGTILGMTKREIDRKFDTIVGFSGVETFLDTPIKRYSTGMQVRLAFAVAAHLEPEILIIDEVLAVGDMEFQNRCLGKMQDVAASGRTVLFVSHNMAAVQRLCTRAVVLENGQMLTEGDVTESVAAYHDLFNTRSACSGFFNVTRSRGLTPVIHRIRLLDKRGSSIRRLPTGSALTIEIDYEHSEQIRIPRFEIECETQTGLVIFCATSIDQYGKIASIPKTGTVVCCIPDVPLMPGSYYFSVRCTASGKTIDILQRAFQLEIVAVDRFGTGRVPSPSKSLLLLDGHWSFDPPLSSESQPPAKSHARP